MLTLMSPGVAISIMEQLHSFLFPKTISGFPVLISLSHWIITSYKIFTSSFSTRRSGACSYHFFASFQVVFLTQFPMNYPWNIIGASLVLLLCQRFTQYEILFHFSCYTFYKVVVGLFYLSCV